MTKWVLSGYAFYAINLNFPVNAGLLQFNSSPLKGFKCKF